MTAPVDLQTIESEYRRLEQQELGIARRKSALEREAERLLPKLKWGDRVPIPAGKHAGRMLYVQGAKAEWQPYGAVHRFRFFVHGMVCRADGELSQGGGVREQIDIDPAAAVIPATTLA